MKRGIVKTGRERALVVLSVLGIAAGLAAAAPTARPAGPAGYDPVIDPADFVRRIDNRYLPFKPGTTLVYEGKGDEGEAERTTVTVTRRTKTVLGVRCVVVLDVVTVSGKPLERTFDWYAQDKRGNVWYMGEDSRDFENGKWEKSDGSWQAGVDGAKPGIVMHADPRPGPAYRQEYYPGYAEDMARVLGKVKFLSVPAGTFKNVLVTREWNPLEPGVLENKYYAPGIGEIKSRTVKGGTGGAALVKISRS